MPLSLRSRPAKIPGFSADNDSRPIIGPVGDETNARNWSLNAPLTISPQISDLKVLHPAGRPQDRRSRGCDMDFETKTPATIEEIRARVGYALKRHPLCRNVQFDIVSMPPAAGAATGPSACSRSRPMRCGWRPISSPTSRRPTTFPSRPDFLI